MRMLTKVFAIVASLAFFASDMKPSEAAVVFKPVQVDSEYTDLINIGRRGYNRGGRGYNRGNRARRYNRGGRRYNRGNRGRRYYRNGGRRYYRNGGRRYYGRPSVGIGFGIGVGNGFIGGSINNGFYGNRYYGNDVYYTAPPVYYQQRPRRRVRRAARSDAHVGWCSRRYRSYSVRTDTYQPYNGRRRRCNSPYD